MLMCEWTGCAVNGEHESECADPECRGCRPRTVDTGRLCAVHVSWLNRDLADAAEVALQVRESIMRGKSGGDEPVRSARLEPPAPLVAAAVDAADELIALLLSVAERLAPEFNVSPPSCRVWRTGPYVQGFPAGTSPHRVGAEVRKIVDWFRVHRTDLMYMPDVLDFGEDLHDMLGKMRTRWPTAERARHLPGTACGVCGLMDLWWTPPNGVGWPITVECHSCDYVAPESDLKRWTAAIEMEQEKRKVPDKQASGPRMRDWVTADQAQAEFDISRTTMWRWRTKYLIREAHFNKRLPVMYNRSDLLEAARRAKQAMSA